MHWEGIYIAAGLVLAAYYLPQLGLCLRDQTGLQAYSLPKALVQLGMRATMMPFVFLTVDSVAMLSIQGLDLALRAAEVASAIWSLRHQGWSWTRIVHRAVHRSTRHEAASSTANLSDHQGAQHGSAA